MSELNNNQPNNRIALRNLSSREFFLFGARLSFGLWMLYVGMAKWVLFGPQGFTSFIATEFDKTWSPHILNTALAWLIIIAEPLFALFLLSGIAQRLAWTLNAALMFLLIIGQTILMKPEVVGNWQYFIFTLVCAALSDPCCASLSKCSQVVE